MTQKHESTNDENAGRDAFLSALYPNTPADLWLGLRCIHPGTGEVRALWTQIGNKKQCESVLQQADKLNREGYGVYFAPCLRSAKKGNAASAALLPALWIDIDGPEENREHDLERLQAFDPPPSAIVASGGGWHGYWLLDEPLSLDEEAKQKIGRVMQGLFTALGGDEGYVKSVASVMRLPGSINTKPDRDGAQVQITDWHPDRRYPLECFDWLEVQPQPKVERIGNLNVVTLNGNAPLPSRTESYLSSGATNGNRNHELFAAACQLRDAGHSQSDAERELVSRYVADGNGSENPTTREKEARATIASAFSQPPREPIQSRRQVAEAHVSQLMERYNTRQKSVERPSTAEIIEAVEACAHLNAVEWAEQREKFKVLTGDGLKISDIDKLYKEKRRELEREQRASVVDTEEYIEHEGHMIYRKHTHRGTMQKIIASWQARILERVNRLDDDGKRERVARVEVEGHGHQETLDVPSELFGDPNALQRFFAANAGETFTVRAGMSKHLTPAILALSGSYPVRETYRFMGWTQLEGRWVYLTPTDCITAKGKLSDPPEVELSSRLRDYGVHACTWTDARDAFDAMSAVFPSDIAPTCIAFAMLPVLQRFFPPSAMRPALHLAGTYGSGKSELAALMSSLYGRFDRDSPPAQWGDTINSVEALGHPLADALYWVDDYKHIYADERTYTRFLQSYSRGMGRGRLNREAKLREERPCRGLILSTGETTIEGEASVLSRMFVIDVPPWEHRDPNGEKLLAADALRHHLPGFTAHFVSWVAKQLEAGTLQETITSRYLSNVEGYRTKLRSKVKGSRASTGRLVGNWAVLVTVYQLLSRFVDEIDGDYMLPHWQDSIVETVQIVREERASEVFLNVLGQLLASGEAILAEDRQNPVEPPPGTTIVGYRDEQFIHLLPEVAYRAVNKVHALKFPVGAIGSVLKEEGWLLTHDGGRNLTVRVRVRGNRVRVWRLRAEALDGDDV